MEDQHARRRALDDIGLQEKSAEQQTLDEEREARLKALDEIDLEDMKMRLYYTAWKRLSMMRWRGKYSGQPPAGNEAFDLVQEAFKKFLKGGRKWDHSPTSIFSVLRAFIYTDISHLAESAENSKTSRATLDPQESGPDTTDISSVAAPELNNPETVLDEKDQCQKFLSMFPEGSDEHKVINTIIIEGGKKSCEIAEATELTPTAYNNVKRRLQRALRH